MTKPTITKETVEKIKIYLNDSKYSELTQAEIALLCGTSPTTVSRVSGGYYDYLLEPKAGSEYGAVIQLDYDTLRHLLACESAVEGILKLATVSTTDDNALFLHNRGVYGVLRAYVPEDVEARLNELREEENNE